jgi:hypothetical protein
MRKSANNKNIYNDSNNGHHKFNQGELPNLVITQANKNACR